MATLKTRPTRASVAAHIAAIEDDRRRKDCRTLLALMKRASGCKPRMWGTSIIGFGRYHYTYPTGREGDWFLTGFSSRRRDISVHVMAGFERFAPLMQRLGKYTTGVSCLYIKRLDDVDLDVLERLVRESVEVMATRHPASKS